LPERQQRTGEIMSEMDLTAVTLASIIGGTIMVTTITKAWLTSRANRAGLPGRRLDALEGRLERIEQAIDTVAVEVERISEAQRFTSKLLAERTGAGAEAVPRAES
jgi:hypothetical protein